MSDTINFVEYNYNGSIRFVAGSGRVCELRRRL